MNTDYKLKERLNNVLKIPYYLLYALGSSAEIVIHDAISTRRFSNLENKLKALENKINLPLIDKLDKIKTKYYAFTPSNSNDDFILFSKSHYYELKTSLDLTDLLYDYFVEKNDEKAKKALVNHLSNDLYNPLTFAYDALVYHRIHLDNLTDFEKKLTLMTKKAMKHGIKNGKFNEYWKMLHKIYLTIGDFYNDVYSYGISLDVLRSYLLNYY